MREQLFDADVLLAHFAEFRDVARDRVTESNQPALDQDHHRGRRGHDFGERSQIEDRINGHRFWLRLEGAIAICAPPDDLTLTPNDNDSAGSLFLCDLSLDDL